MIVGMTAMVLSWPFITMHVFGRPLRKREVVPFLKKYIHCYNINEYSDGHMLHGAAKVTSSDDPNRPQQIVLPYISQRSLITSFPFSYHIQDRGTIVRWTEAHRMISKKHKELLKKRKRITPPLNTI